LRRSIYCTVIKRGDLLVAPFLRPGLRPDMLPAQTKPGNSKADRLLPLPGQSRSI
jgi:hypothetical protein